MFIVTSLCICHPHSTLINYYTLHVLDSMFIVTLCLSSIIIYVLLSMASYRRTRLRGNPKSSNFTSRSCARPRQSPQRVAREPCGNPKSCNFTSRSYTHANPRKGLHGNLAGTPKVATLPRVRTLDHANPRKGLPRESMQRVAFPIDGIGAGSGFRKKDRYTEM